MSEVKGMTPEEFVRIGEKLKKTYEDDTPFPALNEGQLTVMGDANKTEIKSNNYTIKFRFAQEMFSEMPENAKAVGPFYVVTVEYEDVTITPRNDLKIIDSIMKVIPFVKKLKEDGSMRELTNEEMFSMYAYAGEEIHLAVYNLVATFLGINDKMGEFMLPGSVVIALNKIIETHPEIFNEADVFFG